MKGGSHVVPNGIERAKIILSSTPGTISDEVFYRHGIGRGSLRAVISNVRDSGLNVERVIQLGYRLR